MNLTKVLPGSSFPEASDSWWLGGLVRCFATHQVSVFPGYFSVRPPIHVWNGREVCFASV